MQIPRNTLGTLLAAILGSLALCSSAQATPLGVTGFFGNPTAATGTLGGQFSTSPRGVAVNSSGNGGVPAGTVYVVDGGNNRIERFTEAGGFVSAWGRDVVQSGGVGDTSEKQAVTVGGGATGGSFTLSFGASAPTTTAPIPFGAGAEEVKTALQGLGDIGAGNVSVGGPAGGPYAVEFIGVKASVNLAQITANPAGLTPSGTVTVTTTQDGASFEICTVPAQCKIGTTAEGTGGTLSDPRGIAVDQATGNLYVTNTFLRRVEEFDASGNFIRAWGRDVVRTGQPGDNPVASAVESLVTDAAAGTFKLSFQGKSTGATGAGNTSSATKTITGLTTTTGAFVAGEAISGTNIPADAVISTVNTGSGEITFTSATNSTATGPVSNLAADLPFNAAPGAVQSALRALSSIGPAGNANVTVTGGPGAPGGGAPYTITFAANLANNPEPLIGTDSSSLSGGAATATVTYSSPASTGSNGFEVCTAAAACQEGTNVIAGTAGAFLTTSTTGASYPAVAPAGASNAGDVLVGDVGYRRMQEFTSSGAFVRAWGWDVVAAGPDDDATAPVNQFEVCSALSFDACKGATAITAGAGVGQFSSTGTLGTPTRVAEDTAGNVYAVEPAFNFRVQKFTVAGSAVTPQGAFVPGLVSGTAGANAPTDVAVDPTDNHVFVVKAFEAGQGTPAATSAERRVLEFDSSGTLVDTHIVAGGVNSVEGLAVKDGGKPIYLTTSTPRPGVDIVNVPTPPTVTVQASTAITINSATLHGTVNPNGGSPLHTSYRFEYRPAGTVSWTKAPAADIDIGSGEAPISVSQAIASLQPNKDYEVRLVASKGGSPTISTEHTGDFKTAPIAVTAETFAAFWDTSSEELVLRGGVNPNNSATTYFFEYGTEACESSSCTVTATASAGSGEALVAKAEGVEGLLPETTYHFRIVADNGVGGAVKGAEATLRTPPADPSPCPNEEFRTGASVGLAECRAYEWVSDGDSWGSGTNGAIGAIADSGNRAQFYAQAFGQPASVPGASTPYIAERGGAGWTGHSLAPKANLAFGSVGGNGYMASSDLGTLLWSEGTFSGRLRGEVGWSLVGLDGSRRAASEMLIAVSHGEKDSNGAEYPLRAAAADLSDFAFTHSAANNLGAGVTLFPGEPLTLRNSSNLYEIVGAGGVGPGTLRIVNRGGPVTAANPLGVIGGACGAGLGSAVQGVSVGYRAMSENGAAIYFSAEPGAPAEGECTGGTGKRLYKRLNGTTTTEVSAPQCTPTPACPGSPAGDDNYQGASVDGSVAFFTTPRRLLNSDTDSTQDLYAYDAKLPANERLVQASEGITIGGHTAGSGAEVLGVLDNSADGSRVYFVAKGVLSGANARGKLPSAGEPNFYVYQRDAAEPAGRIAFVATLAGSDSAEWGTDHKSSFALPTGGSEGDGHVLLFLSNARLLGEDTDSARDLYRYDDSSGALTCLSCIGEGNFDVRTAVRLLATGPADAAQLARPASADLGSVVFSTAESLVDGDLNGANDVYLWKEGALSLVSAGTGEVGNRAVSGNSEEMGISPDGRNVFFITRAPLVGDDVNNGLDFYDARVGGGFAAPETAVGCESDETCHGPLRQAPGASSPASATTASSGNLTPPKSCKKGQIRKRGRCVRKPAHHKSHRHNKAGKKRAGGDLGGKR